MYYLIIQLRLAKIPPKYLFVFFVTCIRSAIDYGIVSFYNSLPLYLKNFKEESCLHYFARLEISYWDRKMGFKAIEDHQTISLERFFSLIVSNEDHKLCEDHKLWERLPARLENRCNPSNSQKYKFPPNRTKRAKILSILSMCG